MANVQILLLFIACFADSLQAQNVHEMEVGHGEKTECLRFTWKSCSSMKNPPIEVKSLSVSPDPIPMPLNQKTVKLTVSATIDVKNDLVKGLSANATVDMITGGTTQNLCPLFPKYCNFPDVCSLMKKYAPFCPKVLFDAGFSCRCPIKAKTYTVSKFQYELKRMEIPAGINGNYSITIDLMVGNTKMGCFGVDLELYECQSKPHL